MDDQDRTHAEHGEVGGGRGALDPVLLAIGTLTAVRVPPPRSVAAPVPGRAMMLAPLVGLIPGGLAAVVLVLAGQVGLGSWVQAVLAIAVLALATRALHLDGLADFADGLAASYDRTRALAVMRSGDIGPAGTATVVLVLLLQVTSLAQALNPAVGGYLFASGPGAQVFEPDGYHGLLWGSGPFEFGSLPGVLVLMVAAVAGRLAIPIACRAGVPAARPEGLGALVGGSVPRLAAAGIVLVTGLLAGLVLLVGLGGDLWWRGPLAVALAAVTALVVVRRAVTRFGGITGDVIGAGVELATAAALLGLAVS